LPSANRAICLRILSYGFHQPARTEIHVTLQRCGRVSKQAEKIWHKAEVRPYLPKQAPRFAGDKLRINRRMRFWFLGSSILCPQRLVEHKE